jgi:hypothetical protein
VRAEALPVALAALARLALAAVVVAPLAVHGVVMWVRAKVAEQGWVAKVARVRRMVARHLCLL